ncbi:MAG TPA: hypothetical protein VM100_02505, partial [Longimicrobiales bacterium]|nr:hypothetical protein [Longimicrobiales bacterium]
MRRRNFALLVLAFCSASDLAAQTPDTMFYGGLTFRNVGPNRGGRSQAVGGSASRPNEYYFGATGGGVWKTTDGGTTWRAVTDRDLKSSSVGAIGVCEANPDVVYVGMGETELRGNIMQGDGVYKTTNGGTAWTHSGLEESHAIARIRVHPTNCDIAYAAVLGHTYGPHDQRGVFKTVDGGKTWTRVLFKDNRTGAVDLAMDPSNPNVLYAGLWEAFRTAYSLSSGGSGSGLYKSTDGGQNWTELTRNSGLPTGIWGKVGVSVSGADPNRVFAIVEARDGGVYRSDDGGATWTRTNEERKLRQRAFYYTRIYADPKEKDVVYVLNTGMFKSADGGKTFPTSFRVPHGDNHDLWIAANDNKRMINANDGGANVSVNGGQTWTDQDFPTAQLYHIIASNHVPYWVCGAQQDNSTVCVRSRGWPQMAPHVSVGGGESGYVANDPDNPNIFYSGNYGGSLSRYDYATGQSQSINVWPENPMGYSAKDIRERFQWTFPIVFSRTGPKKLYVGSQHLWVSTNEGMSWQKISPDLTRQDTTTMGPSGGPITLDQTGVETYATIFTIAPSKHNALVIWTGSDDGYVQLTRDGGKTWTNVTPKELPPFARISMVEVSPHRPGTAYVAAKRYQSDDRAPYIYRTDDYGKTWVKTVNGIGAQDFVHVVREDPVRAHLLFAGSEHGIYISYDDGANWQRFNRNLPDVQVSDLVLKDNDLAIATHGRSMYIMDNIGQLREFKPTMSSAPVVLFKPADAARGLDQNINLTYYLQNPAKKLTIEVLDAAGKVLRKHVSVPDTAKTTTTTDTNADDEDFSNRRAPRAPLRAGTNRFAWDLRAESAARFPGLIMWSGGTNGPRVLPGTYTIRLTADSLTAVTQTVRVTPDPRAKNVTAADLQAQHDLAMKAWAKLNEANNAILLIRGVKAQIDDRVKAANDAKLADMGRQLKDKLSKVEEEIYQVRNQSNQDPLNYPIKLNDKLAGVLGSIESVPGKPTAQSYEVFTEL